MVGEHRLRHRPPQLRHVRVVRQPGDDRDGELYRDAEAYGKSVTVLPKALDEKVARLHLAKFGVHLTELTPDQADSIGVPVEGPYKAELYRF